MLDKTSSIICAFGDVYKRQLLHNIETADVFAKSEVKVWECRNCGHIVVGTAAPEAVSYTHLDVYKRPVTMG